METALILLVCAAAAVNAQLLNPISNMGMGSGWGGPMWHSGMRYPGMMQTSQLSSMTYPTWRSHPIFRMTSSDKNFGANAPSDVTNVPKVPSTQEVLTHMALAAQNPKPYLDTIADLLYEPQKARTVLTPVASVGGVAPAAPSAPATPMTSMTPMAPKSYMDAISDYMYEPQKARTVLAPMTGSMAPMAPVYVQGMNLMRSGANFDDCVQDGARWERGMDWLY